MTDAAPTAPIRYGAPEPAPARPTECPRCGAPAISRQGVAKHELWHRAQDDDARRQKKVLDRLEGFLDSLEDLHDEEGKPQAFADWKHETDEILEGLSAKLEELEKTEPAAATLEHAEAEIIPWPGDLGAEPDAEILAAEILGAEVLDAPEPPADPYEGEPAESGADDLDTLEPNPWGAR